MFGSAKFDTRMFNGAAPGAAAAAPYWVDVALTDEARFRVSLADEARYRVTLTDQTRA
jgi:hypothetical protein